MERFIKMSEFSIYTDGGSRGNPGPSAIGVVIEGDGVKKEYGEYIGEGTNNEAEYTAVIFALKKLKTLISSEKAKHAAVTMYVDSELIAKQFNNEYKIKEKRIQDLYMKIHNLTLDFKEVKFTHVYRTRNKDADRLVNTTLDKETNKLL
jgi:ribonuclease HI